jgi:hypothetical protein
MTSRRKILVCVEGKKIDMRLMARLFRTYEIDSKYEIVSYDTDIYALYNDMFETQDPQNMDLLQVLKSRETDDTKREIFDNDYSDILLIFDMDPQATQFSQDKLLAMTAYFNESTDTGKLYINYPMVESFYHMRSIPDESYNDRYATLNELRAGQYKQRVSAESVNHDYKKFVLGRDDLSKVIKQNIEKARDILGLKDCNEDIAPGQLEILTQQLVELNSAKERVAVLCTCLFLIDIDI